MENILIHELLQGIKQDIVDLRQELREHVADEMAPHHQASHEFVNTLIEREMKKNKLIDAVIEKTTAALVWSAIVAIGAACWHFVVSHIKP